MKILRKITLIMASLPLVVSQVSAMESKTSQTQTPNIKRFKLSYKPGDYYQHYLDDPFKCEGLKHKGSIKPAENGKYLVWYRPDKKRKLCNECVDLDYHMQIETRLFKELDEKFGKDTLLTSWRLQALGVSPGIKPNWWPRFIVMPESSPIERNTETYKCYICQFTKKAREEENEASCPNCYARVCSKCYEKLVKNWGNKCPVRCEKPVISTSDINEKKAEKMYNLLNDLEMEEKDQIEFRSAIDELDSYFLSLVE